MWIAGGFLFIVVAVAVLYFFVFKKSPSPKSNTCMIDQDCQNGYVCLNKMCIAQAPRVVPSDNCNISADCRGFNMECKNQKCVAKSQPGPSGSPGSQPSPQPGPSGSSTQNPTTVTLKNYDQTQTTQISEYYYKFICPKDNCTVTNITVHASGDANNNGYILCKVNLKDGREIYNPSNNKPLIGYPNIMGDTSFDGNIGTNIIDIGLTNIQTNIPVLNKGDFVFIDWTSNSPGGSVNTYKTNDTNTLAVSLTYTSQ
jgi:hypothetical protein